MLVGVGDRIPLRTCDGSIWAYALVDLEDYERLAGFTWHGVTSATGTVYARRGQRPNVYMHRAIMGLAAGDGLEVDHFDGDGLNNRRVNLRVVTHAINQQNMRRRVAGHSPYRGVTRRVRKGKPRGWFAQGKLDGRNVRIAEHATELDAAAAAAQWRDRHMPGTIEDRALLDHRLP